MLNYINYRMKITITDGRQLVGKFMAFDKVNLVASSLHLVGFLSWGNRSGILTVIMFLRCST